MSRRKQSCPRPVKGPQSIVPEPGQIVRHLHDDIFNINLDNNNNNTHPNTNNAYMGNIATGTATALGGIGIGGNNDNNDNDDDDDDDYINDDNLVIALSPRPDDDDDDNPDNRQRPQKTSLGFGNTTTTNNNTSKYNRHETQGNRNVVNVDIGRRGNKDDAGDDGGYSTTISSRSSTSSRNISSNSTKSNTFMRDFHRPRDRLTSQKQSSTFPHHHLLSSNASSTHPPPNFLLQPPSLPPRLLQQQNPADLSSKSRSIFLHGPPPQLQPPKPFQYPTLLHHHSSKSPVSSALLSALPLQLQPSSSSSSSSLPRSEPFLNEMARRKRSPNSIRWNHRGLAQTAHPEADLIQCQVCMNQIRTCGDIKTPVEQVDYFVDDDGTLTIKNDICPRTVALSLLCGSTQSQKTFRQKLGEDYNMFILNLEQILKKHPLTCPGELASQVASAEDLIHEHQLRQKLLSHSRKRSHDLIAQGVAENTIMAKQPESIFTIQKQKEQEGEEEEEHQASLPDNFLSIPPSREVTPPPHVGKNLEMNDNNNLPLTLSDSSIPKSIFDCDNNNNNNDSAMKDASMSDDAAEGKGISSRSVSPATLIAQGMTVAEAAIANKQMANTKRGSKILPVSASTDGLVKYQCPICSLELKGDHELTVHIRSHNQSHLQVMPNTCTICGKTLSSQSSLDRHMLVHSGERPFKCSICDMSFTTNGNMHRHSRIHQKNGIHVKPIGRKANSEAKALAASKGGNTSSSSSNTNTNNSSSSSHHHQHHHHHPHHLPSPSSSSTSSTSAGGSALLQPQFPSTYRDDLSTPKRKGGHHGNAQPDQNVELLHYMNDIKNFQQLKLLSMSNYMFPFNTAPPTHSAFPISPYVHEQLRLQYLQAFMNPLNGEPLAKRPCFPPFVGMPPPRAPSPDLREPTVHPCKECGAEFTNQFALDSHMESHVIVDEKMEAEAGTACKTCKTVAKSAESLLLHTLTHHKPVEDMATPDPKSDSPPPSQESHASGMMTDAVVVDQSATAQNEVLDIEKKPSSFMNLGFADCTTKKFPLIAKAFCEDNPDLKGIKFPVFKCQHCDKEFPVEGAKELHEASHVPEEYTKCPKCNCHFSDSSRLQDHMLKHVSDLKFEESLEKVNTSDEVDSSENMSQNYFLAQFGLITSEDHDVPAADEEKAAETIKSEESECNFDDESLMDASMNNDDPSESVMSEEDVDCRMMTTTDNEDDARSYTSETKILTIPLLSKEEIRTHNNNKSSSKDDTDKLSLPSAEILSDAAAAMHAGRSPASSIESDVMFLGNRMPVSPLLSLPTKHKDEVLPPMFPCKYCDAVLSSAADLKNHQILHKGSAPFQCKVCPYISTDKSTLLRHMRTHSGERPYKCKLCDYSFTTKANCERHLRQKHSLDKDDLKDQLIHRQFDVQQLLLKGGNSSSSGEMTSQGRAICKSCGVDFLHLNSLQQHILLDEGCRFIYGCKSCKMTFPTKAEISQHMIQTHNDVPADKIGQYYTKMENTPILDVTTTPSSPSPSPSSSSPPPAHSKLSTTPSKDITTTSTTTINNNILDKVSSRGTKLLKSYLTARSNARTNTIVTNPSLLLQKSPQQQLLIPPVKQEPESPLNFAQQSQPQPLPLTPATIPISINKPFIPTTPEKETAKNQDDSSLPVFAEDQPLDLSVSRSSSPSGSGSGDKGQGQGHSDSGSSSSSSSPTKQPTVFGLQVPTIKHEPRLSLPPSPFLHSTTFDRRVNPSIFGSTTNKSKISSRNLLSDRNSHNRQHPSASFGSSKGSSNKKLSSLPSPANTSTNLGMSPCKSTGLRLGGSRIGQALQGVQGVLPAAAPASVVVPPSHLPKHPAFPQYLPIMSSLGFTPEGLQSRVISPLPSSSSSPNASRQNTSKSPVNASRVKRKLTPDRAVQNLSGNKTSDIKISMQAMQPSVILTDLKEKKSKGSSSGSDSSCELAPVSKMLTATDPQNFQEFLVIPETEDEQDSMSVSEMSGEDSNMSMENMFSNSYLAFQRARIARMTGEAATPVAGGPRQDDNNNSSSSDIPNVVEGDKDEEEEEDEDSHNGKDVTLTVGMALLDGNSAHPDLKNKPLMLDDNNEGKHPDPSNMSEQEIARLIEKVSRENDVCPTKKKRNSYADSPHKFACPYCPRCFPWMSSLNRHLLTHTGQKPFRCPRCPVTFSTKSNRERHLIRKHNVNMLDPSSRSTMDRPYKCQLCVFSSFSTKSNLIKHYKERHNGAEPPLKALEAMEALDEFEGMEEGSGKTCEEEEEEYALAQKMQENEGCIMLQGYYNDNNNNDSMTTLGQRDPHKKRNVLFNLSLGDGSSAKQDMDISPTISQNGDNNNNNANSKDNNNNTAQSSTSSSSTSSNTARNFCTSATNNNFNSNGSSSARSSPSSSTKHHSSSTPTLPGIDETVLTDTVREFLDKSLQQSLEDSQRKALEEGSTFWITPAMERHLRRFPKNNNSSSSSNNNGSISGLALTASSASSSSSSFSLNLHCVHCNLEFPSRKKLQKHLKMHKDTLPYLCHMCDDASFATRVECLQHQAVSHREEWKRLEEHNTIRNVEVFATRLDKMVIKSNKRGKSLSDGDKLEQIEETKTAKDRDDEQEPVGDGSAVFENGKKVDDQNNNNNNNTKTTTVHHHPQQQQQTRKILCALCPDVFSSRKELKDHMRSHIGNQSETSQQSVQKPHAMVSSSQSSSSTKPASSSSSPSASSSSATATTAAVATKASDSKDVKTGDDDGASGEGGNDIDDMLHNLLGVESSTIDEIFEAKVSAASILGVGSGGEGGKAPKS